MKLFYILLPLRNFGLACIHGDQQITSSKNCLFYQCCKK